MSLTKQRVTLIGIFALFIGPLILVMLMRSSWWQYQPASLKNQGRLIQPPVQLPLQRTPAIEGKWLVLHVLDQPCEQTCIEHVTALRQIHRAVGRYSEHLAIGLLGESLAEDGLRSRLELIYPEFELLANPSATAVKTLTSINMGIIDSDGDTNRIHTYVLDPMLNVILAYRVNSNPNDIHKDLRRLLKWSDKENTR
jgi:hypothetical protein